MTGNTTHNKNLAYLSLFATCIIWGITWVGSRYGAQIIPGLQLSYLRQCLAGSLLVGFFLLTGTRWPTWAQFKWLALTGFFMFFLNNGLATWSVHYITGGLGALINVLYPIIVVVLDYVFYKRTEGNRLTAVGLLTGIAGVVFVVYEDAFGTHPPGYLFGVLICFIGIVGWSIGSLFIARSKHQLHPFYAAGWQMLLGSIMIFILALATGNNISLVQIPATVWEDIVFLALVGSILTYSAFVYTLKNLPAPIASLYAYINPLVALLAGAALLHEKLTFNLLNGSLITLAGVYLVNYSLRKSK